MRDSQTTRSLYLCLACPWSRSQLFFISCCFIVSLSFMDGFLVERRKDSNSNGCKEIYSGVNLCQKKAYVHSWICLSELVRFKILVFKTGYLDYTIKIYTLYMHKKYIWISEQSSKWRKIHLFCFTHTNASLQLRKQFCRTGTNQEENKGVVITSIILIWLW